MEPSRQESMSRQSSILKAPKQRQPLQCVATNPSSSESSPTIKIKRRVSFAKNKRIREFCNEVEPKEGLDDSYEEHDLSNTKSSSGNSTDHPLVISVPCEDKENFPVQLFIPTDEFECKEIRPTVPCIEGDNLSQCEMEMDSSINAIQSENIGVQNKEMTYPDATIYFDDGMDITASIQPQMIFEQIQVGDMIQGGTKQDVTSSNFTEPISTILGIGNVKKSIESTSKCAEHYENETECFNDIPLEFTSVIPSSTLLKPNDQSQCNDETKNFNCKTMEFTEIVQFQNIVSKNKIRNLPEKVMETVAVQANNQKSNKSSEQSQVYQEENQIASENPAQIIDVFPNKNAIHKTGSMANKLLEQVQDKTGAFPNLSMETTQAVPVCNEINQLTRGTKESTQIFYDQTVDLTSFVANNIKFQQLKKSEEKPMQKQDKTKFFVDMSMEMTEMIPHQNRMYQDNPSKSEMLKVNADKTKVFVDASMEMTEAVPVQYQFSKSPPPVEKNHQTTVHDRTKIFQNKSMDVTEAALNHNKILPFCDSQTKVYADASMEITEAVPVRHKYKQPSSFVEQNQQKIDQNRTKIFQDKSMDVTEAALIHNKMQPLCDSPTKIFVDASMEMTEAVPIQNQFNKPTISKEQNQQTIVHDRTKIFRNKSMDVTEAAPNRNKILPFCNTQTKVFVDASMKMTEGVPVNHQFHQSYASLESRQQKTDQNRTNIFQNKSMDVTEAALNHKQIYPFCDSQTKIFVNASMEMTEAVPVHRPLSKPTTFVEQNQQTTVHDRTKIFQNKSMDVTEALPNHNKILPFCDSQTKVYADASMEITEAVPGNHPFHQPNASQESRQQKTDQNRMKIFQNKSVDVTEALPNQNKILPFCDSQTKVYADASMEINEAVPVNHQFHQPNASLESRQQKIDPNRTKIFQNKSMDVTEAALIHNKVQPLCDSRTKIFVDASMEITKAVPVQNQFNEPTTSLEQYQQSTVDDRTKIFQNKSMDVTEAALNHNKILPFCDAQNQTLEPRQEQTKFFFNASMEMTEAVAPAHKKTSGPGFEFKNLSHRNKPEQTEIFQNKSMELTEAVKNTCCTNYQLEKSIEKSKIDSNIQEKTRLFPNTSITETIPINKEIWQCNIENDSATLKQSKQMFSNDRSIMQPDKLLENQTNKSTQDKTIGLFTDEKTKFFENKSMDFTEILPVLQHQNTTSNYVQNEILNTTTDKTKHFLNNSMDMTRAVTKNQNSFSTNPSTLSTSMKNSERLQQSDIILPNRMNIQESNNEKDNDFDKSSYRDKSFHRMTTDELNTLCASMNLPTQNYTTERNSTIPNDFISVCNDVNVLRDSLQKNTIFQQNFTIGSDAHTGTENNMHVSNDMSKPMENQNNLQMYCNTNAIDRSLISQNETSRILPTEIESRKEHTIVDKHVLKEGNHEISEVRSEETGIRNLENYHLFNNSNRTSRNPMNSSNTVRLSAISVNDSKRACLVTQSDNDSLDNSKTCQIHDNSSENLSKTPKSCVKRKSMETDEINTIAKNSLNRLPSDNTELLIATMGFKTELSHPSSINHRTTIKIPRINSEYNKCVDSDSNENSNVFIGVMNEESSKNTLVQREVFNMESNLSNKENRGSEETPKSNVEKTAEEDKTAAIPENRLSRLPSDNTELLIATMGFKTSLPHPLVINDRTSIKIPHQPSNNDIHTVGFYSSDNSDYISKEENQKSSKMIANSIIETEVFSEKRDSINKENEDSEHKKSTTRNELFSENSSDNLDEIQPPSFLCSDSFQNDSINDAEIHYNEPLDVISNDQIKQQTNVIFDGQYCTKDRNSENASMRGLKDGFEKNLYSADGMDEMYQVSHLNLKNDKHIRESSFSSNLKDINESVISLINEENINTDPLAPFLSLTKSIETYEKRDDCIWTVRKLDQKTVAVDFISRSFVTIIRLNEIEKACIKDIDNIEFISRLCNGSKNIPLQIVHRLLLSKLKPDKLLSEYKMYEDVLPLLDFISTEVILAMDFMFDIERLSALNLLSINDGSVIFMVASRKANIILEISLILKVFNEIGPDDINVTCVLGDIRINDIKQLIVNIRRDSTFLSRYINDVKDYITLMEESTHLRR